MSITKNLVKSLGGAWKYDGTCTWGCNDGRRVMRCSAGMDENDNEIVPPQYWLWGDGEAPRRAEEYIKKQVKK